MHDHPFAGTVYNTPARDVGCLARLFPTLSFILPLAGVVLRASQAARAGAYSGALSGANSVEVVRLFEATGARLHITGMDAWRCIDSPCVFVANHMSTLETLILPSMIQPWKDVNIVVKKSLAQYPFFGDIVRARHSVVVGRDNPREDLTTILREGVARLEAGTSLLIFPQSTRSVTFVPSAFNSIGAKLAKKAGVPIVPIALHTAAWGQGRLIKDFGTVHPDIPVRVAFGAPIQVEDNGKAAHAAAIAFIQERLHMWLAPAAKAL